MVHFSSVLVLALLCVSLVSCAPAEIDDVTVSRTDCPSELRLQDAERLAIQDGVPGWPEPGHHYEVDAVIDDNEAVATISEELEGADCWTPEGSIDDLPVPDRLVMFRAGEDGLATLLYYDNAVSIGDGHQSRWLTLLGEPIFLTTDVELPERDS